VRADPKHIAEAVAWVAVWGVLGGYYGFVKRRIPRKGGGAVTGWDAVALGAVLIGIAASGAYMLLAR
jgi:hypothetical protein